jgi:hypothetical protein
MFVYVFLTCFFLEAARGKSAFHTSNKRQFSRINGSIVFDAFPFFAEFLMLTCSSLIASLSATAPSNLSPRGIKRSRSPDQYGDAGFDGGDHDDRTYISLLFILAVVSRLQPDLLGR